VFGITVYDIIMEKVKDLKYPVCFNFPVNASIGGADRWSDIE